MLNIPEKSMIRPKFFKNISESTKITKSLN